MKLVPVLLVMTALALVPGGATAEHRPWVPLEPRPGPERLPAHPPPQEQRVMSPRESMALNEWARRHLEETEAQSVGEGHHLPTELERLRAMYFLSVEDRSWMGSAWEHLENLEGRLTEGAPEGVILKAYRGALEVVRAKHARWPPTKLSHLREGVGILDRLVEKEPENLEVRYLRLVSCYYLPFFFKREESVREDFQVLVAELPRQPEAFSPAVYRGVVEFVLDKGEPAERDRALLREAVTPGRDLSS
jgi:hypothetical protein